MRVTLVVDALTPRLSGIGRYTWELCKRVPNHPDIDGVNYFSNGHLVQDPAILLNDSPVTQRPRLPSWFRTRIEKRRLRASLVHGTNYFLPAQAESGIITVHDLSVFRYSETHPPERLREFERDFQSSLLRARHIITDTETARGELISDFGLSESAVSAVPLGVSDAYRPQTEEEVRPRLKRWGLLPQKYALCVSTLEPRKKIAELIRAWRELPSETRSSMPLVLAGAEGWLNESLHDDIRAAVAAGWLKHIGFVPELDLPALYAGAALFLYPSTYEGFGLPPVEAMASGVPVIVANSSCLPEVCGDAAAYVDPMDVPGFSAAIAAALADDEWRNEARAKGLRRAAGYSWENCAERTVQIYRTHCRW